MDADDLVEMFAGLGAVKVRRMFGGAGVYTDGIMFALMTRDVIYLKADQDTIPDFEREGLKPFTFAAKAKLVATSYWRMPDRLYDDPEELGRWAERAVAVARRAAERKTSTPRGVEARTPRSRRGR